MKVLLTHGEGRLEGLASALASAGFRVMHIPLIKTERLTSEEVRAASSSLLEADWLLFTSRTAVAAWAALKLPLSGITPKLGVVGEKTREEVLLLGGEVALTARPANARGLLESFLVQVTPPLSVGLPCGEGSLPMLADGLLQAGFSVNRVPLYRTVPQPLANLDADVVVMASPSAVAALPKQIASKTRFVALGPSTYRALLKRGLNATESATPDIRSVVEAVMQAMKPSTWRAIELETL